MNTIVSAFVSNINDIYENSLKKYSILGKVLLKSTVPKVIYVDEIMFDLIGDDYDKSNTLIIKINKKNSYLYDYAKYLTKFNLNSNEQTKDTLEYIFTICNKTEWVQDAILLNKFKTKHFIWLDFGIRNILNGYFSCISDEEFIQKINNLKYKTYNNIRISGIWNTNFNFKIDIYKDKSWYFMGDIFGGSSSSLIKFASLMKTKCIDIITSKNTIMWEVNIWYLIYKENSFLFDIYGFITNKDIIDNY